MVGNYYEFIKMLTLVNRTNGRDQQPREVAFLHSSKVSQNIMTSILDSMYISLYLPLLRSYSQHKYDQR
jgi:hypothetical protein